MSSSSHKLEMYDKEYQKPDITAGNNLNISSGNDINLMGAELSAGNNASINTANNINVASVTDVHEVHVEHTSSGISPTTVVLAVAAVVASVFTAGAAMAAFGAVMAAGTAATAAAVSAAGMYAALYTVTAGLVVDAIKGTETTTKQDKVQTSQVSSNLMSGADFTSISGNDTTLIASFITAGGDLNLTTGGELSLLSAKNTNYESYEKTGKSMMYQTMSGRGTNDETVVHSGLTTGGAMNISAAGGINIDVQANKSEELNDAIDRIAASDPRLAYMATLKNNPSVNWNKIAEAHEHWDYRAQGLTEAGAAIVAIAVTIATAGQGSQIAAGLSGTAGAGTGAAAGATAGSAAGAGTGAAAGTAAGATAGAAASTGFSATIAAAASGAGTAAANAAFTNLVTQATIALINNQGDISATFEDLASSETLKSTAFAALTAGLTGGVNVHADIGTQALQVAENAIVRSAAQSLVYGDNFVETLPDQIVNAVVMAVGQNVAGKIGEQHLNTLESAAAHAVLGCGIAVGTGRDCQSGAIGGAVAETMARLYASDDLQSLSESYRNGEISQEEYLAAANQLINSGKLIGEISALTVAMAADSDAEGIYTAYDTAHNAVENNFSATELATVAITILIVADVAMSAYMAYDVYQTYQNEGPDAAAAQLVKEGIILVATNAAGVAVYKIGKVVYPTLAAATAAWLESPYVQKVASSFAKDTGKIVGKTDNVIWPNSGHAAERLLQRGLTKDQGDFVITNGTKYFDNANNSFVYWLDSSLVPEYSGSAKMVGVAVDPITKIVKTIMKRSSTNLPSNFIPVK